MNSNVFTAISTTRSLPAGAPGPWTAAPNAPAMTTAPIRLDLICCRMVQALDDRLLTVLEGVLLLGFDGAEPEVLIGDLGVPQDRVAVGLRARTPRHRRAAFLPAYSVPACT